MDLLKRNTQRMVLVDLSRSATRLALAEKAGDAVRFNNISRIEIPPAERSADDELITAAVGVEVRRNGWQGMPAACLLSGQATSTQSFLFPPMPKADLRKAIELKLRDTLHFDLSEATFDYRSVQLPSTDSAPRNLILVAVARQAAVKRGQEILARAGLRPVIVGAAAESLANLVLRANLCQAQESTVHVDMGEESTIVNLFEGTSLRFSREVDVGHRDFHHALLRPILTPGGAVQLTPSQAAHVQTVAGYPGEGESLDLPHGIQAGDLLPLLEPVAHRLSNEIGRSLEYLRGMTDHPDVDRIVLSGTGGAMRRLDGWLEETLETPVTYVDPVERAKWHWRLAISDEGDTRLPDFSAILGFSLGNHQPINLIPKIDNRERVAIGLARTRQVVTPVALAVSSCLALAAVPGVHSVRSGTHAMRGDLALLRVQRQTASRERSVIDDTTAALQRVLEERGPELPWRGVLLELAVALPEEARIDSLEVEADSGRATVDFGVRIPQGVGEFQPILTQLTSTLSHSPFFREVQVLDAHVDPESGDGVFHASMAIVGRDSSLEDRIR